MALRLEKIQGGGPLGAHHVGLSSRRRMDSSAAPASGVQDRSVANSSNVVDEQEQQQEEQVSLGDPPAVEPEMPFNPFLNAVPTISNPYELVKTIIMIPIALLRIVAFTVLLLLGLLFTKLALLGAKDVLTRPFPRWRRALFWPVRLLARALLFACGFHWITIKGRPAPREKAPILVCNHVTFVDPVFIFYMHLPVIVTAEENLHYPVMGAIISAMQVIAINRGSEESRRVASGEIKRRAMCNDWSRVMIFPEATTTNGKSLVSFKTGAFAPGYPVQPMLVRYPHLHMDPSWVALGPAIYMLLFRLMTQFHNYMVVEYLPVIEPTLVEQRNPRLFTERTRMTMAKSLNVMVTEHCFEDLIMAMDAQKTFKDYSGVQVIEFGRFEKLYKLKVREGKKFYVKYRRMDPQSSGCVSYEAFVKELGLPDCHAVRKVFSLFDGLSRGCFNFRQYVNGLAFVSRFEKLGETIDAAYGLCDRDEDGKLSFEDVASSLRDLIPSIQRQHVIHMWNRINSKCEKVVSRSEFVEFLEANPEYVAVFLFARTDLLSVKAGAGVTSPLPAVVDGFDGYGRINNGKLSKSR